MASQFTARQNGQQRVICLSPSINKTQVGNVIVPIPYPVQQSLAKAAKVSKNVYFNREKAFTIKSHTRKVTGDAPGRLKGIISNTTGAKATPKQHSKNIRINKKWLIRCGDQFKMNKNNTMGTLVCCPPPLAPPVTDDGLIEEPDTADNNLPDMLDDISSYSKESLAEYEQAIRQTLSDSQQNWDEFVTQFQQDPLGAIAQQASKTYQALQNTVATIGTDIDQWASQQASEYQAWWDNLDAKNLGTAISTFGAIALGTALDVANPMKKIKTATKLGKVVGTGKTNKRRHTISTNTKKKKVDKTPPKIPPLRQKYIDEVNALPQKADKMRKAGMSSEKIAKTLHAERRAIGIKYKDLTPTDKLKEIHARNIEKYGDKLGPSIQYLRNKGKTWDDIIESAARTGGKDLKF